MAKKTKLTRNPVSAVSSAIGSLLTHKEILFPFAIIAFVQLLVLEILYFYPRYPLNTFFEPIVSRIHAPDYMHYPQNFILLPKLFQSVQIPLYIVVSSFFIGVAVAIIVAINDDQPIQLKKIYAQAFKSYIYLALASLMMFLMILGAFKLLSLVHDRALIIGAVSGPKFWIKNLILKGVPFYQFFISVFVTSLFIYVIPIIMVDKRRIISALIQNFKVMFSYFFFTLFIVFLPSLLYLFIMLIRKYFSHSLPSPEWGVILIIINILILIFIDAVVYTAATLHYLLQKENQ